MDWNLVIDKADNGYTAEYLDEEEDGRMVKHQSVFEMTDDEKGELNCMVNLLYFIKEHFGIYGSKHDRYLLNIEIMDLGDGGE